MDNRIIPRMVAVALLLWCAGWVFRVSLWSYDFLYQLLSSP